MSAEHFEFLAKASDAELEGFLKKGRVPDPKKLAGNIFRGYNTPPWASLLGIRKFVKGFFEGQTSVEGFNIPVKQNGFAAPWVLRPHPENPKRFGFYRVVRVQADSQDNHYPNALLLDYGASHRNFSLAPERVLRDYLVHPFADDPDVLLGKAYLALGPARVPVSFFILERLAASPWRP